MPRGGPGRGQGRRSKIDRYGPDIVKAENRCRDRLPATLDNLEALADGTTRRVEAKYQPAGTIFRKDVVRGDDGKPLPDSKGRFVSVEVLSFPDLAADEMVLIERKEIHFPPDLQANQYLADRVLGKNINSEDVPIEEGADDSAPVNLDLLTESDFEALEQITLKLAYGRPEAGSERAEAATGEAGSRDAEAP